MAELDRAAISTRIAEAREKRAGLTQPELAELLQVHWRTVQDWESPKNDTVPWGRLDEIGRATDVSKEWLLHGDAAASADQLQLEAVLERVEALRGEVREIRALVEQALAEDPARATTGTHRARPTG
jgi:transcriptional regulator with XRE-family HTH domain